MANATATKVRDTMADLEPPAKLAIAPESNLYQKLAALSASLGAIEKDGQFSGGKVSYQFISHAALLGHLRKRLADAGVVILPSITHATTERIEKTNDYGVQISHRVVVEMAFTVVNTSDPSDRFTETWWGEGIDSGDKATQKAATSGEKYFLFKLFKVSDKDDPDAENPGSEAASGRTSATPRTATPPVIPPSPVGSSVAGGSGSTPQQELIRALRDKWEQIDQRKAFCESNGTEYRQSVLMDLPVLRATELLNALQAAK